MSDTNAAATAATTKPAETTATAAAAAAATTTSSPKMRTTSPRKCKTDVSYQEGNGKVVGSDRDDDDDDEVAERATTKSTTRKRKAKTSAAAASPTTTKTTTTKPTSRKKQRKSKTATTSTSTNNNSNNNNSNDDNNKGQPWNMEWQKMYNKLKAYKEQHGTCNVPKTSKKKDLSKLSKWVQRQRQEFHSSDQKLRLDKIELLNAIGFDFDYRNDVDDEEEEPQNTKKKDAPKIPAKKPKASATTSVDATQEKKTNTDLIQTREGVWNQMYERLREYKLKYDTCNVPDQWQQDRQLANWVIHQRRSYRKGKLSPSKIGLLNKLEFQFNLKTNIGPRNGTTKADFDGLVQRLEEYKREHGHTNVSQNYNTSSTTTTTNNNKNEGTTTTTTTTDNNKKNNNDMKSLANFVRSMRINYRKNKLSQYQINALNNIGFAWRLRESYDYNDMITKLIAYKQIHGNCNVPQRYKQDPSLGRWIQNQRVDYNNNKLSQERIMKLEELGFEWKCQTARPPALNFDDMIIKLKEYKERNGHCNVPGKRYKEDKQLGTWVETQRRKYRENKLSPQQMQQLEELGFVWSFQWNKMFEKLKQFKAKRGHADPKPQGVNKDKAEYAKLLGWVAEQRLDYDADKLSADRVAKLEEIGFPFHREDLWMERFEHLKKFHEENGHCRVPKKYHCEPHLSAWICRQRELYNKRMVNGDRMLPADRIAKLEELGFVFNPRDALWEDKFTRLKQYAAEHDGSTRVKEKDDKELFEWVSQQRFRSQPGAKNPLSAERIAQLQSIGFEFKCGEAVPPIPFDEMVERLRVYRDTVGYGSCNVPQTYRSIDPKLTNFVMVQRAKYRDNKLSPEQIQKLEELGFQWRIKGKSDDDMIPNDALPPLGLLH